MSQEGLSDFRSESNVPRCVTIAAPHTSNWDGIWALTYKVSTGLDIRFFAKQSLFWFPLSILLRRLGGIPLDRREPGSAINTAVEAFRNSDDPVVQAFVDRQAAVRALDMDDIL